MGVGTAVTLLGSMLDLEQRLSWDSDRESMAFNGTIGQVMEILMRSLQDETEQAYMQRFLYAQRLIAGITEYSADFKNKNAGKKIDWPEVLNAKIESERIVELIYKWETEEALQRLGSLYVSQIMREYQFTEKHDPVSWAAYSPKLNNQLAADIAYRCREDPVQVMVIDGNDGYRSGYFIAAALGIQGIAIKNSDAQVLAYPSFIPGEEQYIAWALNDKHILLYGEDVASGAALASLKNAIERISSPRKISVAASIATSWNEPRKITPKFIGEHRDVF
jgi:hypothetical protein